MNTVATKFGTIVFDNAFVRRFCDHTYSSAGNFRRHIVFTLLHAETREITDIKPELLAIHGACNGKVLLTPYGGLYVLSPVDDSHSKLVWMQHDNLM